MAVAVVIAAPLGKVVIPAIEPEGGHTMLHSPEGKEPGEVSASNTEPKKPSQQKEPEEESTFNIFYLF